MNEVKYLVDNNALVVLRRERIRSDFFRSCCRVTADVLWEAGEHPELATLALCTKALTSNVIEQVRDVMKTLDVDDTRLVDLYGYKGTADPGLIASVLDEIASDDDKLFGDTWVLVTNDVAVAEKAAEFDIATIKPVELAQRIDAATE